MEVIDIGLSDLEPISLNIDDSSFGGNGGVNFGSGIELLMNDKKKSKGNINIDLGNLDSLENELNELSGNTTSQKSENVKSVSGLGGFAQNWFGIGGDKPAASEPASNNTESDSNLGQATHETMGNTKTWDGFSKMNEIPNVSSAPKMNERERRRKKRAMIKKLEEWYEKGIIKSNTHFNMESNFEEVEDEYETALEDKRKKDSIKLQGWWFMTFVNSIEYANSAFDPFGMNLDGWGEQVSEDLDSYDEIFSELHEKYKGGKLSPELSLLLRLGFSAAVVNFTNKALSSATPAFNDVIKQSPELMKMFTNATVNSMSQQSPGFAFANNIMGDNRGPPPGPSSRMAPPPPVETKNMQPQPRPAPAPQMNMNFTERPSNRPDIAMGRGMSYVPDESQERSVRREMRGPQNTDLDNILSGLKSKSAGPSQMESAPTQIYMDRGDDSMISISSLKDLQNTNMPKKSRRKNRSDKNTISLDLDI